MHVDVLLSYSLDVRHPLLQGLLDDSPKGRAPGLVPGVPSHSAPPALQGLLEAAKIAQKEAKAAHSMILKDELKARRRVLRRLGWDCIVLILLPPWCCRLSIL